VEVTAAAFEEDVGNRYSYQLNARFGRDDDDGGGDDDDGAETEMETDAYAGWTGTSMAAPIVAGAALARMSLERGEGADGAPNPDASGAFLQTCFTHRPVSTLDRVSFRLTGELFLYGTTLRREAAAARRSHGECAVGQARPAGRRTFRFVFHPPRTF
jgi:subtilisin family serine protease